jgi:hypothetical protein
MFVFDGGGTVRADTAQQRGGTLSGEPSWPSTSDELPQRHVQPAGGLGAQRGESS